VVLRVTAPAVAEIITVALVEQAAADLAATRARRDLSETDIVNRAITLHEFIDARMAAGSEVLVRDPDGTTQAVLLL
jgi:hypothetical protein